MFDAAMGPRLEAKSLRIRRVFSAAGTFALTADSGRFAAVAAIVPAMCPPGFLARLSVRGFCLFGVSPKGVRYPVLKLAPTRGVLTALQRRRCLEYRTSPRPRLKPHSLKSKTP